MPDVCEPDEIDLSATYAIAQGWCEPEAANHEMDVVLAEAIAKPVRRLVRGWYDTALQHHRNEEYYRGLVVQIGEMLGEAAYTSDDGTRQEDVLCAKVPETRPQARHGSVSSPPVNPNDPGALIRN